LPRSRATCAIISSPNAPRSIAVQRRRPEARMLADESFCASPVRMFSPMMRSVWPAACARLSSTRPCCATKISLPFSVIILVARAIVFMTGRPLNRAIIASEPGSVNDEMIALPSWVADSQCRASPIAVANVVLTGVWFDPVTSA
jgi:hypothetical protein